MFKIIGADGKEYGPVTAEQLKQWIADGRVNQQTKVLVEGETEWKTIAEIPELASVVPITPTAAPTVLADPSLGANKVKGPAIALIVAASLGIAYYLFSGVFNLVMGGAMFQRELPATIPPELRNFLASVQGPFAGVLGLVQAAINAFVLLGAIKMLKLRSYGLAMAACIVAMLPCQCCCVLGLPFGIWGLVMLTKPEVKSAFQ